MVLCGISVASVVKKRNKPQRTQSRHGEHKEKFNDKTWKNVKHNNHNISKGNAPPMARLLLKMRDGPRGRAPDIGFTRLSAATGVPVPHITNPSVKPWLPSGMLCVVSALSAVKNETNAEKQNFAGQHRLPNKSIPPELHPGWSGQTHIWTLAGGNANVYPCEIVLCTKIFDFISRD